MTCTARLAVVVFAAATVALGGCHGAVTAPPRGVTPSDPLGSGETSLDRIEKQIDHDGAS
jgi:hypothetical protein